jgi:hypothetical protein
MQDVDLEYDPSDLPDLVAPMVENRGDVCLGSQFLVKHAGSVLYYRHYLANQFLTFLWCGSNRFETSSRRSSPGQISTQNDREWTRKKTKFEIRRLLRLRRFKRGSKK